MKKFIEKLIGRLEEEKESNPCRNTNCKDCKYTKYCYEGEMCYKVGFDNTIEIVNQLAEEYFNDINAITIDAGELLGNSEQVKKTNADRIRAMSDEELAEWLAVIDHYWNDGECIVSFGDAHVHDSKDSILDWLQSDAE